ncbi:MAG: asparagine synthase (glutamine-hydrolyzing) [Vicinamibacteria bacterium]|jgi:asparagine synthase (glutamine-hydrolysing)|nr:asparagine synthase (glutamine-hydrolyzing) [Vicinamibacteria bacterium]
MCGIAGIISRDSRHLDALAAMVAAQRHRGPDDEGYLFAGGSPARVWPFGGPSSPTSLNLSPVPARAPSAAHIALGHRRLAILDLSPAGHQPMATPDGRYFLIYNGEIYNYIELRDELRGLGYSFHTGNDGEVLLAAYAAWGAQALPRLNGMWSFAIYDTVAARLFCARDRFGVKPFHYYHNDTLFAFASEIKGLLAHPAVPRRPHAPSVLGFLTRGHLDEGAQTFLEDIFSLPAGHQLALEVPHGRPQVSRWYELPQAGVRAASVDEFRTLLEDAVRLRLRSDVDVGTCLSGGLDSSALVALTARHHDAAGGGRRRAFSIVYADHELDESSYIRDVVAATGVIAEQTTATAAELWADLAALTRAQDEPIPSPGPYSHWRVMALAHRAGMKVLLDGQGADELLAGYEYHFGPFLRETLRERGLLRAWREARGAAAVTGRPLPFWLALLGYHALPLPAYVQRMAVNRFATHGRLSEKAIAPGWQAWLRDLPGERHRPQPSLRAERAAGLTRTSLPALLRYEDRNSMAFGIETRTPFLDYRLVELGLGLPCEALMRDGWTKSILREAMRGLIPDSVRLRRRKLGFPTPERRFLSELAPQIRLMLGAGARIEEYVRKDALSAMMNAPAPSFSRQRGLWRLVALEAWLRWLNGEDR